MKQLLERLTQIRTLLTGRLEEAERDLAIELKAILERAGFKRLKSQAADAYYRYEPPRAAGWDGKKHARVALKQAGFFDKADVEFTNYRGRELGIRLGQVVETEPGHYLMAGSADYQRYVKPVVVIAAKSIGFSVGAIRTQAEPMCGCIRTRALSR